MAVWALEPLQQITLVNIPDSDALVQRSCSHILSIRGNGDCRDPVLYGQGEGTRAGLDVPKADGSVSAARGDGPSVSGKVQGVDILLVSRKRVSDRLGLDVPNLILVSSVLSNTGIRLNYPNQLVLGTSSEVLAIRTEAHAPDVEVAADVDRVVLKNAISLAAVDVEDLGRPVAARRHVLAVVAEAHTAHNTLVREGVNQVHIQHPRDLLVEDAEPVVARLLRVGWEAVRVEIAEGISDWRALGCHDAATVVRRWVANLGGLGRAGEWDRVADLRCRGTDRRRRPTEATPARARRCGALRWLRAHAVWARALAVGVVELRLRLRLRRRGRWRHREAGPLGHLVLRASHLLVLRLRRGRGKPALAAARHDAVEQPTTGRNDGGLLGLAGMGRGAAHSTTGAAPGGFELAAEHLDFLFVPAQPRLSVS